MKRFLIGTCLLALAFGGTGRAAEPASQTASYTTGAYFFFEDCSLGLGVACFDIGRNDLSTVHVSVDDLAPYGMTLRVDVLGPGGTILGDSGQFCDEGDVRMPQGMVAQLVVHVGGFQQEPCGPVTFHDPFEDSDGYLGPSTAGTVTITY